MKTKSYIVSAVQFGALSIKNPFTFSESKSVDIRTSKMEHVSDQFVEEFTPEMIGALRAEEEKEKALRRRRIKVSIIYLLFV